VHYIHHHADAFVHHVAALTILYVILLRIPYYLDLRRCMMNVACSYFSHAVLLAGIVDVHLRENYNAYLAAGVVVVVVAADVAANCNHSLNWKVER